MNSPVQIRFAIPNEASRIVEIIRQGFSPSLLNCTIYSCEGVSKYVEKQITAPVMPNTVFGVAGSDEMILGAVELRLSPENIFLNYIAVRTDAQGMGIGKLLLRSMLEMVFQPLNGIMQLDVFEDNIVARKWYEHLGFQAIHKQDWWDIQLPQSDNSHSLGYISGYPQAETCHNEFGFSQFQFITLDGEYTIGRVHNKWFRLTESSALETPVTLSALSHIDDKRHVLAILPEGAKLPEQCVTNHLTSTFRMTISLQHLKQNLGCT